MADRQLSVMVRRRRADDQVLGCGRCPAGCRCPAGGLVRSGRVGGDDGPDGPGFDRVGVAGGGGPAEGSRLRLFECPAAVGLRLVVWPAGWGEVASAGGPDRGGDGVVELAAPGRLRAAGEDAGSVPGDDMLGKLAWRSVAGAAVVEQRSAGWIGEQAAPHPVGGDPPGDRCRDRSVAGQLTRLFVQADQRRPRDGDLDAGAVSVRDRETLPLGHAGQPTSCQ